MQTGTMHTLDRTGDQRVMWDKDSKAEGKKGDKGEQIRTFDPDAERIILVKPLVGG